MPETKPGVPSAADLRMVLLQKEMEAVDREAKARAVEEAKRTEFADGFLRHHVSDDERAMIRRLVMNAVKDGKFEAMVYSFPSELCIDGGRAINNNRPDWPDTLQGKARQLYDSFVASAKPQGYKLKAMIINFPGGVPGDVGFFLNWAPDEPA
jgi:hypothetical protein